MIKTFRTQYIWFMQSDIIIVAVGSEQFYCVAL